MSQTSAFFSEERVDAPRSGECFEWYAQTPKLQGSWSPRSTLPCAKLIDPLLTLGRQGLNATPLIFRG